MQEQRTFPVQKTDEQWKAELTPEEYAVLRKAGTERPWTGEYNDTQTVGVYSCRACDADLFESDTKFDSHCGWPSFYAPKATDAVVLKPDRGLGMTRTEVLCASCGSHLGHVFDDTPKAPPVNGRETSRSDWKQPEGAQVDEGALRYCMNSVSMRLKPKA